MSYPVYLVESLGMPRNHQAIFIQTDPHINTGVRIHVKGNIQTGMEYEVCHNQTPEQMETFLSMSPLGWVKVEDYDRLLRICEDIPVPKKQFDGAVRLYEGPLRRCQEWTREAIQALRDDGVLRAEEHGSS